MAEVFVKLEAEGFRECFVVQTERTATEIDHVLRAVLREGIQVTCLPEEGATKYGWADDARR